LVTDPRITFYERFDDSPMSATHWDNPAWTLDGQASSGLPTIASGGAEVAEGFTRAAVLKDKNASTATLRETAMYASSMLVGSSISLLMDLDDVTPITSQSVRLKLTRTDTAVWTLTLYLNEAPFVSPPPIGTTSGILRLALETSGAGTTAKGYFSNQTSPNITKSFGVYNPDGSRVGFALRAPTGTSYTRVDYFSHTYITEIAAQPSMMLCASAGGKFYRENTLCDMSPLSTSLTLRSDRLIGAANRLERLFIADYGLRAQGTDGSVSAGTTFDDVAGKDWAALGVDTDDDRLEIYAAPTGTTLGFYRISARSATTITLASSPGDNSGISYRIVRGPKVYDAATDALELIGLGTIGTSQFPIGCRHFSLWDDRIVACNDPLNPNSWYMGAKGYPFLWDYGDSGTVGENGLTSDTVKLALGEAAAIAPNTLSKFTGLLGDTLVCTIPIRDDLLVFACKNRFYYLRGNPRAGGRFNTIPGDQVGILDIGAFCWTPDGRLFVLTLDGLYELTLEKAVAVSREVLPQELLGLDAEQYEITMGYDMERRGFLIACVSRDLTKFPALPSIYYFYDLRAGGFFPESRDDDCEPTAMVSHQICSMGIPILLMGCRDGYIKKYNDDAATDDGTPFNSNVFYGPVRLGEGEYGDGYVHELVDVLDLASGSVTIKAYTGYSAQVAKNATSRWQTTTVAGRNYNRHPRLRGGALYLETVGTPGSAWVRESLTMTREKAGKLRVV
jgi:hypothetical protein